MSGIRSNEQEPAVLGQISVSTEHLGALVVFKIDHIGLRDRAAAVAKRNSQIIHGTGLKSGRDQARIGIVNNGSRAVADGNQLNLLIGSEIDRTEQFGDLLCGNAQSRITARLTGRGIQRFHEQQRNILCGG